MSVEEGRVELRITEPLEQVRYVDPDREPLVPEGWRLVSHMRGERLRFDPSKIELYQSGHQKYGRQIGVSGHRLAKELATKVPLNAVVLDHLIAHPQLIPDEWKAGRFGDRSYIFFWGTQYRYRGDVVIRGLRPPIAGEEGYEEWGDVCHAVKTVWHSHSYAAVLKPGS